MLVDAIKQLLKSLEIESEYSDTKNPNSYKFFKQVCLRSPLNIPKEKCPIDDKFFEYLRSLSMAHPFNTNRPTFLQNNEIHYSPWVIPNNSVTQGFIKDGVGVRIYSNKYQEIQDLYYSFSTLKDYIHSRYLLLNAAKEKVNEIIYTKEQLWKTKKVPRNLSPIDTLKEISRMLIERSWDNYMLDLAISYLSYTSTYPSNNLSVSKFHNAILDMLPSIIQAVDDLDYSTLVNTLDELLYARPIKTHQMADYEIGKVFSYLNNNDKYSQNYYFGLQQADNLMEGFVGKWVAIDTTSMDADEIKLLVRAACYLEKQEQDALSGSII